MRRYSQFQTTAWTKNSIPFNENATLIAPLLSYFISVLSIGLESLIPMTDSFASQFNPEHNKSASN